jgi:hypothetical protein
MPAFLVVLFHGNEVFHRFLYDFEQASRAHAAAYAHGDDNIACSTAFPFDQGMTDQTGARHAVGMPNGNSATIDIE